MIPTSDRRIYARETKLIVSALCGPYLQHVVGDRGEHVEVHPTIPIAPFRFAKYGDYLYISGTYVSRFDGRRFVGVTLSPLPYAATGGVIVGDKYILSGFDYLRIYDLRTNKCVKAYYDFAFLYYINPAPSGYVGTSTTLIVHVDENFNVVKVITPKGVMPLGVVYYNNSYYAVEDKRYVRRYDINGNLVSEKQFVDLYWITVLSDGVYIVYDDGVARLDENLNVTKMIRRADVLIICELGDYYYLAVTPGTILKVRRDTLEVVSSYNVTNATLINGMRATDDGNLLISVTLADGTYYVKILSPDFVELYSISSNENPYIWGVNDVYKIPNTNMLLASNGAYGINFKLDMSTNQITWVYTNFAPYDVDFNGKHYALAMPLKGEVRILDESLNVVKSVQLYSPSSLKFLGDKLYVADYYANAVFVLDRDYNLIASYDLSKVFTKYSVWSIGRFKDKWFLTDSYTKIVLMDDNFNPIKEIPIKVSGACITDFTEFKGKYYMLDNANFSVHEVDLDGNVKANYTYPGVYYDKAYPSHTGGLILVGPYRVLRFFRDMQIEKTIPIVTTYFYKTPKDTYVTSYYVYGPTSIVDEYDLDGRLVRRLVIDGIIAFQACVTLDDMIVISNTKDMDIRKYDWSGNLIWRIPWDVSPKIAPRYNFNGVWTYGYGAIKYIDLNGNVSTFISESGTFFFGIYEDERYVYVLDDKARVRRYSKDGRFLGVVYESKEYFGIMWLMGGVEDCSKPFHVFR